MDYDMTMRYRYCKHPHHILCYMGVNLAIKPKNMAFRTNKSILNLQISHYSLYIYALYAFGICWQYILLFSLSFYFIHFHIQNNPTICLCGCRYFYICSIKNAKPKKKTKPFHKFLCCIQHSHSLLCCSGIIHINKA